MHRATQVQMAELEIELSKNADRGQYELTLDGRLVSLASYRERDGVVVIPHTETRPEVRGRGLAGRLVRYALDDIASSGYRVDPACPYVDEYIQAHPEYEALRAP
jgi:uncharacterized protein